MPDLSRFLLLSLLWAAPAAFAETVTDLPKGGAGVVDSVIDGDTVRLRGGQADIRLIGIQAPKLPLGRKNFKAWPLAGEARAALDELVAGRNVDLRSGTVTQDRNGRILAHVVRDDGLWIQGEMLRRGWARMYTFPDNRRLADDMRRLEHEARRARRGIWAEAFYAVRRADSAALVRDNGTYQIVAGRIVDAARVNDRVYLNFGTDFRADFTISVGRRDLPAFDQANVDLLALAGKDIEVRGWIALRGGPAIEVSHPEQIEIRTMVHPPS
jgi:micrococcal nuclease